MGKDKGKSEDEKLNEEPEITEIDEVFEDAATSRFGAGFLRWIITFAVAAAFAAIAFLTQQPAWGIVGVLGAAVLFSCMHVVLEWERTVVLRFGKFNRVAGPGLIFMIPFVEYSAATVDLRMRSTAFKAEHVLTSDLVPVDVDAVLFWMVWDAGKACSEIRNYERLVYWVAQTTLRDVMGAVNIAQLSTIEVPCWLEGPRADLQEALSAEARAEREYNARIILAEVEKEVSEMFVDAARTYKKEDAALQLRAMSFVADSVKEKGGLVVVPSALSEAFEGLEKIAKG